MKTKSQADRAIRELNGKNLLGRAVSVGRAGAPPQRRNLQEGLDSPREERQPEPICNDQRRIDAVSYESGYCEEGKQLWVGRLPKMGEYENMYDEVRSFFNGFEV